MLKTIQARKLFAEIRYPLLILHNPSCANIKEQNFAGHETLAFSKPFQPSSLSNCSFLIWDSKLMKVLARKK